MPVFRISIQKETKDIVIITCHGIIDAYSYHRLEQTFNRLIEERIYKFVVDLSRVSYMSSTGATVFIRVNPAIQKSNGYIVLVNPGRIVKDLFDLLGFNHLFMTAHDMRNALSISDQEVRNY